MNNTENERIETSRDRNWVDQEAYEPWIVSLGPYHRDKPHLQATNQLKWKYLKVVLDQNTGMVLNDYVDLIEKLETQARDAYSEEVNMSSNSFVEMMLLDGCFVILTMLGVNSMMKIARCTRSVIVRDILMLENQLPFFLLETLCKSAFPLGLPFRHLAFNFIRMSFSSNSSNLEFPSDNETFHHIIHLFLFCIDPTTNHGNGNGNGNQSSSTFGFLCNSKLVKTVFVSLSSKLRSQVNKIRTGRDANPEEDFNGNGNGNQSSSTSGFLCNSKLVKTVLPSKLRSCLLSQVNKIRTARDANPEENLPGPGLPWIPSVQSAMKLELTSKENRKPRVSWTLHFIMASWRFPNFE
ncbi:hypothetical protein ZIOFF_026848 [Zingiber officinale]|uniref:Uncharacterized protein n=1 Tax=Zingiber officinale TaxID=94328 RepID=A0A8J5H5E4_ZINOF|nr:hypothetical protein ZIOFF_026848 [Zingiber officinale]